MKTSKNRHAFKSYFVRLDDEALSHVGHIAEAKDSPSRMAEGIKPYVTCEQYFINDVKKA
ncbi:hypothetical protein A9Q88_10505 [Gammaproteobacteria bacterium 50_400_T64]|nr:hypothetical protein A9Q88_10505 [Gammaproteobacteria bacterium 50_400_T64]